MNKRNACVYVILLFVFNSLAFSQATITWTRTAFEAGAKYTEADQIALITTNCGGFGAAADWYGRFVSWTSGSANATLSSSGVPHRIVPYNGANRDVVFNGTYPVYANSQTYSSTLVGQTTTATVTLRLHCLDYSNPFIDIAQPQQVKIFDRILVDDIKAAATTVQGGKPIELRILMSAPAQKAGTRVELEFSGPARDLLVGPLPDHIDVPTTQTSVDLRLLTTKNDHGPQELTIVAKTKNSKQVKVSIIH